MLSLIVQYFPEALSAILLLPQVHLDQSFQGEEKKATLSHKETEIGNGGFLGVNLLDKPKECSLHES